MTGVLTTRSCAWCGYDVPRLVWRGENMGEHLVVLASDTGIVFEGVEWDGNTMRFTATEHVKLALCKDVMQPATGLARMQQAIDASRGLHAPSEPVVLCDRRGPDVEQVWTDETVPARPSPWAGAWTFWRWVAERLFA